MSRNLTTVVATLVAFSAVLGRLWVFGLVRQGTDAMSPALEAGEVALFWRQATPEPGDLVVVELPDEPGVLHVKRLLARGPASVELVEGALFVDGERLGEPVPEPRTWSDSLCRERTTLLTLEHIGERQWSVEANGDAALQDLSAGTLWVLGDLRGSSEDSRQWGPLRPEWVKGVVAWRIPGPNPCGGGRRWERFGRVL